MEREDTGDERWYNVNEEGKIDQIDSSFFVAFYFQAVNCNANREQRHRVAIRRNRNSFT